MRWRRRKSSSLTGSPAYEVVNLAGRVVLHVHRKDYCGFWYVYVGEGQDEPDGIRFNYLWEAKAYAERQVAEGRVSVGARLICEVCGSPEGQPHRGTCPFLG